MKNIFYLLLVLALTSCKKEDSPVIPDYPDEPTIKFKSAEFSKGVDNEMLNNPVIILELVLDYTDGDSNFGGNFDSNNPNSSDYEYDFILTFYKKIDGEYTLYGLHPEFNPMCLRFPEILDTPYDNGIVEIYPRNIVEGELVVNLQFPEPLNYFEINDTLKCTVQILDRDYNFSNLLEIVKIYPLSNQ